MAEKVGHGRRRRIRRWVLAGIAVVILGPIATVGVLLARLDPNAYKPAIEAAIARASGTKVALNGPLSLRFSLQPTIRAADVEIANPPGFSRPEMASIGRLDAKVALLPLLRGRVEIRSLVLVRPKIAIEINRAGKSNLSLGTSAPTGPTPIGGPVAMSGEGRAPRGEPRRKRRGAIGIAAARIESGTISWRDDRSGAHGVLELADASVSPARGGAAATVAADAVYRGLAFHLRGTIGPLSRLEQERPGPEWPVDLTLTAKNAKLVLAGSFTDPARLRGGRFRVTGDVPALDRFGSLFPGGKVPALHEIRLALDVATNGEEWPSVSNVALAVGRSDLGNLRPGLTLDALSVRAPGLDQPCKVELKGTLGAAPLTLNATLGAPARLLPHAFGPKPARAAWPVAIQAKVAGARVSLSGTMGEPRKLGEASLALSVEIPELDRLGGVMGRTLPHLRRITFTGQLAGAAGGWRRGVRLSSFSLVLPAGEISGEARLIVAGARPDIIASLTAERLDIDALRSSLARTGAEQGAKPASGAPANAGAGRQRAIPDVKLPFHLLRLADADVGFTVRSLTYRGSPFRDVKGRLVVTDGRAKLDPFSAETPAGRMAMTAVADASEEIPSVAVTLAAPSLELAPLLHSFSVPAVANGTLAVEASLRGTGASPHAIAADASGAIGLAMVGGSIDERMMGNFIGDVLRAARIGPEVLGSGRGAVRCFAFRLDAVQGTGTVRTLLLDTARLTLSGTGSMAFGPETLALRLDPELALGADRLVVPFRMGGTFLAPKIAAEPVGAVATAAELAAGRVKRGSALGQILGVLAQAAPRPKSVPSCREALALARFGKPGPEPMARPSAAPAQDKARPAGPGKSPLDLLHGLIGR